MPKRYPSRPIHSLAATQEQVKIFELFALFPIL
jgi:hypothetical protein